MTFSDYIDYLRDKRIGVIGFGVSNQPLVRVLLRSGCDVTVCDRRERAQLGVAGDEAAAQGAKFALGADYLEHLDFDVIFRTPGVLPIVPQLRKAAQNGAILTSEMEAFCNLCPCRILAITGSDGKTTTSTITAELLRAQGYTVHLGGNIGRPLLPEICDVKPEDVAVVELSSFQLISMRRSPNVAVITNLSPNHLDVHKDMDEYVNAKKNVLLHQNAFGRTVLNADNALTAACAADTRGMTYMFSRREKTNGAWCSADGKIYFGDEYIMEESDIRIPGKHNVENYLAAISAVWGDVSKEVIRTVAKEFNGVEHRMEFVRELDGVRWYNDSIATSPSRAMIGTLSLYDFKIVMIAGGADKKVPFDELGKVICDKVKTLVLLAPEKPLEGFKTPAAGKIEAAVRGAENYKDGAPVILHANNMKDAVRLARESAEPGDVVSLCPAATGFDMYKSFAVRGDIYREEVKALK